MVSSRKTTEEQGPQSPRKSPGKEVAESSQMALAREASGDDNLLPHVATIEEVEGDELDSDLEELDELLPSAPQGTEESTPTGVELPLATEVRDDGSKIDITRTWDLQTTGLGIVEVVCQEAMSKYRTCAAYTYEEKGESSMGIFFHGEREASEDTNEHHLSQGQAQAHKPLSTLPPTLTLQAAPLALPDLTQPPAEGTTDDTSAQHKLRKQALDVVYDTIQDGEWSGELKRAFKAVGLALGVDAYEAYPKTFGRAVATRQRNGEKVKVDVNADVVEDPVAKNEAEVLPARTQDAVDDTPAPLTEKSRGKKRARNEDEEAVPADVAKSSQVRRVRHKGAAAPLLSEPQPDTVENTLQEAPPAVVATRRSARTKKTVQKTVKPLVERTTAAPPAALRAKQPEVGMEPPPPPPPTVQRERPVLMCERRPGRDFVRTVYYSPKKGKGRSRK